MCKLVKISEISKYFTDFFCFFCRKFVTYINKNRKAGKRPAKNRKGELKTKLQKKNSCKHRLNKFEKYKLVSNIQLVINRKFPKLVQELSELPDYRKRPRYEVNELIISGLLIFLFKQGSRNQADNTAKNIDYQDNIKKIFGIKVADTDTVDRYLRFLPPKKLANIKKSMISAIVSSKTLNKHKFQDKYFMVAIDGTGLQSFDYEPYPSCPFKKYKSGKKIWTTYVLEAKIVSPNGFSLSLSSVWVENPTDKEFVKQDSEYKAFIRLTTQVKKEFPRLPMMFLLDGLYPKNPIFNICKKNNWGFIITLKDKVLKSVQEQISDKNLFNEYLQTQHINKKGVFWLKNTYKVYENIDYKEHKLCVIETNFSKKQEKSNKEENTRFVHITNIKTNTSNAHKVSSAGRLRWKIENEGFNNQKNSDYNLSHKFSRKSFNATKNYYQLLQIADIINQFTYKLKEVQKYIKEYGYTLKSLIQYILSLLKAMLFSDSLLITSILKTKQQLLY